MQTMYPAQANSPGTELAAGIDATQDTIQVADGAVLPDAPNLLTIGTDEAAETILYTGKNGDELTGITRGFQGSAHSWAAGTKVARYATAYDHDAARNNIEGLYERLDVGDTTPTTLQPGLQVINAERDARFRLEEIQGKTEINGQGQVGLIGVENPYAIGYGENLLPPFYEWADKDSNVTRKVTEPYKTGITLSTSGTGLFSVLKVLPGQTYTFSVEIISPGSRLRIGANNGSSPTVGTFIADIHDGNRLQSVTIPSGVHELAVVFLNKADYSGSYPAEFTIENPMFVIGSEPKPFMPRRDTMLAFQTELHANPTNGSEPDVLFEKEGQYFKLAKWKKVVLDGTLDWRFGGSATGYKWVNLPITGQTLDSGHATKYNGLNLTRVLTATGTSGMGADKHILRSDLLVVSISNTDSGWGDSYTPTTDEIKAYFMGWKMLVDGASRTDPYNGTGGKAWYPITRISDTYDSQYSRTTLPTDKAPNKDTYVPYNLLYRLAKETVESVVSEGCLTLLEGDNLVEVDTGIVLRERANMVTTTTTTHINNTANGSNLKFRTRKIMYVYRNSRSDYSWNVNAVNADGEPRANITNYDFDPTAAYSVTYIKRDKSPIQPITGNMAANEKAQISGLTSGVAEALQRVSVVEQSKYDKGTPPPAPQWIYPTLLNNWTLSSNGVFPAQYWKDPSSNVVYMSGIIVGGANGSIILTLPVGYRPKTTQRITSVIASGSTFNFAYFDIAASGNVTVYFSGNVMHLSLKATFIAEL